MATSNITTYKDAIDNLLDYIGGDVSTAAARDARRAILNGYRSFATSHHWSYLYQRGRITTSASQTDGTVAYDHTGGAYERQLTITDSTWPSWAAFGTVVIDSVAYDVAERKSNTVVTLSATSNPGADIASGTTYTLYRDTYPMPTDFVAADQFAAYGGSIAYPVFVHPSRWLLPQQLLQSPATPSRFTFMSDPNYLGAMAVRFHPAPDNAYTFDFIYHRRPRPLVIDEYKTGTVSASSGSATVTGSSTAFASKHAGAVFRISSDSTNYPVGPTGIGGSLFAEERTILSVDSATQLTVDSAFTATYSGVKYLISDPIDLEEGAMMTGFFRECEKQMRSVRRMPPTPTEEADYKTALLEAREADSRFFASRSVGDGGPRGYRLADMPRGADVS